MATQSRAAPSVLGSTFCSHTASALQQQQAVRSNSMPCSECQWTGSVPRQQVVSCVTVDITAALRLKQLLMLTMFPAPCSTFAPVVTLLLLLHFCAACNAL
jgi:hypothetical protein